MTARPDRGLDPGLPLVEAVGDGVWTLTLNRPSKLNALTVAVLDGLVDCLNDLREEGARVVVLSGSGRAFSAGGDVHAIQAMSDDQEREHYLRGYARVGEAIAASPFPVIAALHGAVYGGGFELAAMADFRVGAEDATFCAGDIALGLVPTGGLTWRLPHLVGAGRASWLLLTNAVIGNQAAHRIGLTDVLSPEGGALETALIAARSIAHFPREAVTATKHAVQLAAAGSLTDSVEFEVQTDLEGLSRPGVIALLEAMFPKEGSRSE